MEQLDQGFLKESLFLRVNKIIVGFVFWMTMTFGVYGVFILKNKNIVSVPKLNFDFTNWSITFLSIKLFYFLSILFFILISIMISYSIGHWVMKKLENKGSYFFRLSKKN